MGSSDTGRRSPFGGQRVLPVKNYEASAIPMGGVVWLDGSTTLGGQTVYLAKQADGSSHPWFVALSAIPAGGRGLVTCDWPAQAAYDTAAATPAVGDEVGPVSGNWRTRPTGEGLTAITAGADGWVTVNAKSSAATSIKLVKPSSGQSLSGASPGTGCTADVYEGTPGSEADTTDNITIYGGRQLESGQTVSDTDWLIVGRVNDQWQLLGPRGDGGGTARFAHATLTGDMTTSESAKVVTIVRSWDGTAVTGNVTAYNVPDPNGPDAYLFEGLSGDIGMISYDPENAKWWFVWVECGAAAAATSSMAVKGKPPQPSVAAMSPEAMFDLT